MNAKPESLEKFTKFLDALCEENQVDPSLVQSLRTDPKLFEGVEWDRADIHFPDWENLRERILQRIRAASPQAKPEIFRDGLCFWPGVTD